MSEPEKVECAACGGRLPVAMALPIGGRDEQWVCPFCDATVTLVVPSTSVESILKGVARMLCANLDVQVATLCALLEPPPRAPATGSVLDQVAAAAEEIPGALVEIDPPIKNRVAALLADYSGGALLDTPGLADDIGRLVVKAISDAFDTPLNLWPGPAAQPVEPEPAVVFAGDVEALRRELDERGSAPVWVREGRQEALGLDWPTTRVECLAGAERTWWFEPRTDEGPATLALLRPGGAERRPVEVVGVRHGLAPRPAPAATERA